LLFVVFQAKLDCISAFALNSLVWMWLRTNGENPKETGVKTELDRVKASMLRLKEIQDKSKRNPVDAVAAKRLVKGGLWQPKKRPSDSKNENQERKRSKN
jgi:exosome complex protein LRP1